MLYTKKWYFLLSIFIISDLLHIFVVSFKLATAQTYPSNLQLYMKTVLKISLFPESISQTQSYFTMLRRKIIAGRKRGYILSSYASPGNGVGNHLSLLSVIWLEMSAKRNFIVIRRMIFEKHASKI